jgi:hypothetical protein
MRYPTIVRGVAAVLLALTSLLLAGYHWPRFDGNARRSPGQAAGSSVDTYNWPQFDGAERNLEHIGDIGQVQLGEEAQLDDVPLVSR